MLQRVILHGTTLYPTEIEREDIKIAESERMANGTLRQWLRDHKNKWTLTWEGLHESYVPAIRALYRVTGPIVFNDTEGTVFNVISMEFTDTLSASKKSVNGDYYFDITFVIEEV